MISFPFLWRWSWVISLPVICVFFLWGWNTFERYYTFEVHHQISAKKKVFSIWKVGAMEFSHLVRKTELALSIAPPTSKSIRSINLFIPEANLATLNSALPHSGFNYVKGGLWHRGKLRKVKVKYRGDSIYHWGYYKKSLRVKTKKNNLFEGMRAFNLIAPRTPEMLNNYLSFKLGSLMGLISPKTEVVNVNINGKFSGIYILTEQLEEGTLRSSNMMPGDLYSGDLVGKGHFSGIPNKLFSNAEFWKKVAINNHYPEQSRKPLEKLIKILNMPPSVIQQNELSKIIDMQAFGRFNALELLVSSVHVDAVHNWRIYYDPYRSQFVPIVWDLVGWYKDMLPRKGQTARLDSITSPLHLALYSNGDFLRARQTAIEEFFYKGTNQFFLNHVEKIMHDLKPSIHNDPNLVGTVKIVSPEEVEWAMKKLKNDITKIFDDIRKSYLHENKPASFVYKDNGTLLEFSVDGRQPVKKILLKFLEAPSRVVSAQLSYWQNGELINVELKNHLNQKGAQIEISIPLFANFVPIIKTMASGVSMHNHLDIQPSYYEIDFSGINKNNPLLEVLVDRNEGETLSAQSVDKLKITSFNNLYQVVPNDKPNKTVIWQGDIEFDGITEIDDQVIIRPGTAIRFSPGATLILTNRLIAEGSPQNPIRFLSKTLTQEPWGAVVLKGKGANGSRLRHVEFTGGSGLKGDLFEYTAMFSVHDVQDVNVSNSIFRDSKVTDDMVHVVYSEIRFTDSTFERSLSDGLDIDISHAIIERCRFFDSGNDAIDLMTSHAVVIDSVITNSRDKAISVGEGSQLLAINNLIKNNEIGIQTKDGSVAALYNIDFVSNAHALDAYKKNWRYDNGGETYVYKSRLINNNKMITADKKSTIQVYDSFIDKPIKTRKNRIKVDRLVDSNSERVARIKKLDRNKNEMTLMRQYNLAYGDRVNATIRGYTDIDYH